MDPGRKKCKRTLGFAQNALAIKSDGWITKNDRQVPSLRRAKLASPRNYSPANPKSQRPSPKKFYDDFPSCACCPENSCQRETSVVQ